MFGGRSSDWRRQRFTDVTPRIPEAAAGPQHPSPADFVADLYRQHGVALVRLALLLVGDQASAEDVVQEAFLGLYRNWSSLNDYGRLAGYLRVAVVNGSRSVLRARRRAWLIPVRHDPPVWSAEAAAMATEERRAVLAAMARLPRRQREVLVLRYYAGLTDTEIASALAVSRGTVVSTASRALGALGRQVKEEL
jgi:RNA polymerase sigma-70 factor (sigma-E family)